MLVLNQCVLKQSVGSDYTPASETQGGTYKVVWLDFSDAQSMTVNADGSGGNPSNGNNIGRVYNKADPSYVGGTSPSGSYFVGGNGGSYNTWNSAGYLSSIYSSGSDAAFAMDAVGSYILSQTNANSAGWTVAAVCQTNNTSAGYYLINAQNSGFGSTYVLMGGTPWSRGNWRFGGYNLGGIIDSAQSANVNKLLLGKINLAGGAGAAELFIDGTSVGTQSVTSGTTQSSDATSIQLLDLHDTASSTIRVLQLVMVNRPIPDVTNLTNFLKAKGGIS